MPRPSPSLRFVPSDVECPAFARLGRVRSALSGSALPGSALPASVLSRWVRPRRVTAHAALALLVCAPAFAQSPARSLFDGETLRGWNVQPGEEALWSVADGRLRGGSLERAVARNSFLVSDERFANFELRVRIRISGSGGLVNSGIQLRSRRVPGRGEVSGYQVDVGDGWWGKLYDEARRNRVIAEPLDEARLLAAIDSDGWNDYRIRAEGGRIRSWINGVPALDYEEVEGEIPLDGRIGIQVHSGDRVLVEVDRITVEELPPTDGAMSWARVDERARFTSDEVVIRDAAEEAAGFDAYPGFEVELVTSDPLVDKVVDIAFDDGGRMWAITAREYPLDANETEGVAERYRAGGRDRVLVFDEVWKEGPHEPRVFADGLFLPLALLPTNDGLLLGQGPEILRLRDADGDGRADAREVVLSGFGIQDSHLLPHRFVRAPDDWIYVAQGAFNTSHVETKSGEVVLFDQCEVGRFRPDGSAFEVVGVGLNNIWGFVLDRLGDKWIQEANDLGYPVVPFEHGRSYPGIGMDRMHPWSPWAPPLADFRMGGTGLSGLALSQDRGGFPAPWDETFFVANPITSRVQAIRATRDAERPSDVRLARAPDLLVSADSNFRPVAIHFGPDGCLYVVDWYNPIISHNEVPRDHPDRDKVSSRIWRVRHERQARCAPLDVASLPDERLIEALRADATRTARAAWRQIVERGAVALEPALRALALDASAPAADRVLALWCLGDLGLARAEGLAPLAADTHPAIRREVARLAATCDDRAVVRRELFGPLLADRDPRVRRAALESALREDEPTPALLRDLLALCGPIPEGPRVRLSQNGAEVPTGEAADRLFEQSLVRAYFAEQAGPVAACLSTLAPHDRSSEEPRRRPALALAARPIEASASVPEGAIDFALLACGTPAAARQLVARIDAAEREPSADELGFLANRLEDEGVRASVVAWISRPSSRATGLRMLLDARDRVDLEPLRAPIVASARAMLVETGALGAEVVAGSGAAASDATATGDAAAAARAGERRGARSDEDARGARATALRIARELRFDELTGSVLAMLDAGLDPELGCLRALVELGYDEPERYRELALAALPGRAERRLAVTGLARSERDAGREGLVELWPLLERSERTVALDALLASERGARDLVTLLASDAIEPALITESRLNRLREHLGGDAALVALERRLAAGRAPLLRLDGGGEDYVATALTLDGPFTVEAWVRLDEGITNDDGLLLSAGRFDFNFWNATPRLWLGPKGDVLIASRPVESGRWFHLALVRDAGGGLALYRDGVLDRRVEAGGTERFDELDVGRTGRPGGTAGWIADYRVWDHARDAEAIGANFRRRIGSSAEADGLVLTIPGDDVELSGNARIEGALDGPPVTSDAELAAERARFNRYRVLARADGSAGRGRELFSQHCAACHTVGGEGGAIGPVLDGVGAKGIEGLLRSILTPNAGVESGYRTLIVRTTGGEWLEGFLAEEDERSIVLRRKDREDLRLERAEIESARFDSLSLMPEGLLDPLSPAEVTDLFDYLRGLE